MLKRFRRYLSPPMVISMIALFVALGGGYALAFVGSGQLQKGGKFGLTSSLQTIRSLDGIGSISASCSEASNDILIRFDNDASKDLRVDQVDYGSDDGTPGFSNTTPGGGFNDITVTFNDVLRWYVHPQDGSKRPQAEIMIGTQESNTGDAGSNCTRSSVHVLVLNTEE
jgi:hypothetical protein